MIVIVTIGLLGTIATSIVGNGSQTKIDTLDADGVYLNNTVFQLTENSATDIIWVGNGTTNMSVVNYTLATTGKLTVNDNTTIKNILYANYNYSRLSGVSYVLCGLVVLFILIGVIMYIAKDSGLSLGKRN